MSELGRNEDLALTCEYDGCEEDCPNECSTCAIAIKTDGDTALIENKLPSAIPFYKRALFLEPRFAEAWNNLANAYNMIGLHPQLISSRYDEVAMIGRYIHNQKYIGEIGLDYGKKFYFSKERQKIAFEKIMYMCSEGNKVISIHSAFAASDVLDIIDKYNSAANNVCILHWFSGTNKQLQKAIELGCYFSVNERMLQKGNLNISQIPFDRILVETDYPFIPHICNSQEIYNSLWGCLCKLNIVMGKEIEDIVSETSKKILS